MSACLEEPTHKLLMVGWGGLMGGQAWFIQLVSDCHAGSVWASLERVSERVCAALNHCCFSVKLIFCQQSLMKMLRGNELGSVMLLSALKVSDIFKVIYIYIKYIYLYMD